MLNPIATSILAALLNTLWYAAAVVLLAGIALRGLRHRVGAAARCRIWFAVLILLLLLPCLPAITSPPSAPSLTLARASATHASTPLYLTPVPPVVIPQSPASTPWPLWLLALWALAALWQLNNVARALFATHRLKRNARRLCSRREAPQLATLLESPALSSPAAVGFFRPAVILPIGLLDRLPAEERNAVLLHEAAHLERADHWMLLAERILGALLVLHPLAAFVRRRIERERERACDDLVVARTGRPLVYAQSLARLHQLRVQQHPGLLVASLWGRHSALGERIESLLQRGRDFRSRSGWTHAAVSAAILVALLAAGGLLPRWIAFAQSVPDNWPKAFDAVSIKPGDPSSRGTTMRNMPGGKFSGADIPLKNLIALAFDLKNANAQLIGLPSWAQDARFSIEASAPAGTPALQGKENRDLINHLIQALLVSRFGLQYKFENRNLPVYDLVIAKGGSKLKPASPDELPPGAAANAGFVPPPPPPAPPVGTTGMAVTARGSSALSRGGFIGFGPGKLTGAGVQIPIVAQMLSGNLGKMVVDETGLTGYYDFTLTYDPASTGMLPHPDSKPADPEAPSLFTAIQDQLGLQLKSAKGPVQVLVITHLSRPTAN